MTDVDLMELLRGARAAARAGGAVLLDYFARRSELEVEAKGVNDLVSQADRDAEAAIVGELQRRFGVNVAILGEEGGWQGGSGEVDWILDPLDGTTNFLEGLPIWSVSVACQGPQGALVAVVLDPINDRLYSARRGGGAWCNGEPLAVSRGVDMQDAFLATGFPFRAHAALDLYLEVFQRVFLGVRGIRRCGSAALDLAHTAAGIYDAFFELRLSAWDLAAGMLLVREAGGVANDWDGGDDSLRSGNIIAGNATICLQLQQWLSEIASEAQIDKLVSRP